MSKFLPGELDISKKTLPAISQFAECLPSGFFIYTADEDEKLIYFNSCLRKMFRCDTDEQFRELVNDSFKGIVYTDDLMECEKEIYMQSSSHVGSIDRIKYRIRRLDGSIGKLDDYGYRAHSEDYGDVYCVIVNEISDEEENDNLRTVVSVLSENYEMLFHMDFISGDVDYFTTGPWVDKNDIAHFTELSYAEKIKYFAGKYVVAEDRNYFLQTVQIENVINAIENGRPLIIRFRMLLHGKTEWYELKAVHQPEHIGQRCAIVGIRNVESEMEYQENMARMAMRDRQHLLAFHDIIHSGMWNIILDEESNILQVKWSDEYRHLLGYTDENDFPDVLSSWHDKIHPEDKEAALQAFWKGAHSRNREVAFDTDFRVLNKNGQYGWYHAAGRIEPNEDGTYLYFGIFVDSTAQHENEQYQAIQKQNLDIIEILASEYSSVYYIDLATDGLKPYSMNAETESEFGQIFNSGITYSEAFRLYVDRLILEEDKKMMLHEGSLENIKNRLRNQKTFITSYRSSDNRYNEMKFVKVGDDNAEPVAVALGFADRDEEIRESMQAEQERQRNFDIIEILASEYSSVYYIDLTTDELNPYTMNEETETTFGSVFRSGITYSEAYNLYVEKLILDEDKSMMLHEGSVENIRRRLKNQKTFITNYRSSDNRYNEMKFVKVGDDNDEPVAVALGFADRDEEIRESMQAEQERQRNFDIIEILASEYSSVYYIDLTTDELNPYTMNEETETTFGSVFRSGITYSEAYNLYVDKLILEEDKSMMLREGSVENIRRRLTNQKTFITNYRSSDNRYNEMKFVKVGDDNEAPVAVALGFADRDEEIREKMQVEQEHQRNFDIIEILASEYSSVYYIDLTTDELNPYTMNDETETTFGSVFRSGITYSEAYNLYVEKLILDEDKSMMLHEGSVENIRQRLKNQKTFITNYRSSDNRYNEMKFVKVGDDNDEPVAVALGFADRDEEIRSKMMVEQEHQRNFDIIEILASEYSSVYYIDLTTDELNPYTMNDETETTFGSVFRSGIIYSEAYRLYVDKLILEEDKKMMLHEGSVENIRQRLRNQKTFITNYRSSDNRYNEMKFVKVGGDNDEPVAVALGFADRDEEIRRKMLVEQERQRNFDIIEILASEYTSVYYIDLTTDELNPYTMNADTESAFGQIFRSGIRYSDAFRMYVDQLILSEDKAMMLKAGSIGNIMKELRTKKTFLTTYRNSEGHYSEMKFVKVGNDDGLPTAVALGFADKDDEIRAREEEQQKLQRNIDIIEILASEYTSVYYIDLTTDELDPYTMNADTESTFGQIFRSGIHYSEAFKMYVNTLVYEEDRAMMLQAGSIYNILKEMSSKKTFITTYRNSEGHYSEMKFVKVGDEENPQAVALGFADKDQEIRSEMERKETAARDAAVITGLSDDFGCVVYTSYEDFSEIHYRFDPLFEEHIEGWSKINNFAERLDKLINTIMHPDDRKTFWEATRPKIVRAAVEKDSVYYVNFRTLIDDEITYYQCKFVKDDRHKDTHVIAGFHNVDAETKREMDALNKANSASRAKTDFLFNMSHDIRTPMNAIIGFTNMAIKDIENHDKAIESLEKVRISSDMLLSLINDILDMSRIESGKVVLNEEKFDISKVYDQIEPVMTDLAHEKDIDISFDIGDIQDSYNFVDLARVERVLVNLISNAIKYTPAGGTVRAKLEQDGRLDNNTGIYRFVVSDNGIGMSEEFQKHMFEEFSREETSTNSGIQGTGLGLALAQKLVQLMNGEIRCESKQGVGSTFTVILPLRLQTAEEQKQMIENQNDALNTISLKGKKVLLVDDNDLNREIAACILEDEGIIVETAVDGKDALNTVIDRGNEYYDFILMDIQMPVMDGYKATQEIRKAMPDLKTPIIALSANAFEEDKKKSKECGMDDHIAKPIGVEQLLRTLQHFQ